MRSIRRKITVLLAIACIPVACQQRAHAALSATATVSTASASAPYHYTIDLHNTGDTNIGTLWFAWTTYLGFYQYNYLPTSPTGAVAPTGWIAPVTHNGPGDGYGIEFYNISGSPIAPGGSGQFQFTSNESPAVLAGNSYLPPDKVATSFVYVGFPQQDPGLKFTPAVSAVPEPATLALSGLGAAFLLGFHRNKRRSRPLAPSAVQ
jgi:hypothetical protein